MPWGYAAAGIASGVIGSAGSKSAAKQAAGASLDAMGIQRDMFNATRGDLRPFYKAGVPALERLMYLTGLKGEDSGDGEFGSFMREFRTADFERDPGYQFRLEEGEKALSRAAAARGLSRSTPGLKALLRFNQDFASNEFGAARSRFEADKAGKFNFLSYLVGTGHNAAAQTGQVGANLAAGGAQAIVAGGQAAASGTLGAASAWNNAIQGGLGNYMYQQRWDEMMKRFPVFSAPSSGVPLQQDMVAGQYSTMNPQYG